MYAHTTIVLEYRLHFLGKVHFLGAQLYTSQQEQAYTPIPQQDDGGLDCGLLVTLKAAVCV